MLPRVGPRERLIAYGGERIATDELLAVVLGTGSRGRSAVDVARAMLDKAGGLVGLSRVSPLEIVGITGVGEARATRVVSAFHLGRRALAETARQSVRVNGPEDVAARLLPRLAGLEQEVFIVMALDVRNTVLDEIEIARGSVSEVAVHPREVFRPLVRRGAFAAVVAHNHPSGDPTPSPEDLQLTLRLRHVGDLIGIPILDHVIVAGDSFASIAEELAP